MLRDVSTGPHELALEADFGKTPPEVLFEQWTRPEHLERWWPERAELDAREGGLYHLAWPSQDRHLRGVLTRYRPPTHLDFTWRWDHEGDDLPERTVQLQFTPTPDGGTRLHLVHAPYGDGEGEQSARRSHLEGWAHFIDRLRHHLATE